MPDPQTAWMQPDRTGPALSRPSVLTMKRIISSQALVQQGEQGPGEVPAQEKWKHKLYFQWEMIAGVDLVAVLLAASVATFAVNALGDEGGAWPSYLSESKPAISTLGAFYSFALVFRTNICYARWWEGRSLWGELIVNAIRITQQGRVSLSSLARVCRSSQFSSSGIRHVALHIANRHSSGLRMKSSSNAFAA